LDAPLLRFVSLRHIVRAKVRSLLTPLGVAPGVAMLVRMTSANQAVLGTFHEMVDRASGKADLEMTGDKAGVEQTLVDELGSHTELVAHVAGRIEQTSSLMGENGQPGERVLVLGIDFLGDKEFLPFKTEEASSRRSWPRTCPPAARRARARWRRCAAIFTRRSPRVRTFAPSPCSRRSRSSRRWR
jgi:hypothetical protein